MTSVIIKFTKLTNFRFKRVYKRSTFSCAMFTIALSANETSSNSLHSITFKFLVLSTLIHIFYYPFDNTFSNYNFGNSIKLKVFNFTLPSKYKYSN